MAQAAPAPAEAVVVRVPRVEPARLVALRAEVDPDNRHGPRKVLAAVKALGVGLEDFDLPPSAADIQVSPKIPSMDRSNQVREQRRLIKEGLREARLRELEEVLEGMKPDDVRRFERTGAPGDGVRPVRAGDVPEVSSLAGMANFEEMQSKQYAKIKADQQRKANILATGFLQEKKRMDEADAQLEALEKRLKDYKKQQEELWAVKRKEAEKKAEKRQQGADRAFQVRRRWEEETELELDEKLAKARKTRAGLYSKDTLKTKMADSEEKRHRAFQQAVELERSLLARIETKQEALEERLEARRQQVTEELTVRVEASQAKFCERQVKIYASQQEWAEKKLDQHAQFQDHFKLVNGNLNTNLMTKSKSCIDFRKKALDKWRTNFDRLANSKNQGNSDADEKRQAADDRAEAQAALKLKCDIDVFTFREVKHTWDDLRQRRFDQLHGSRDSHTQALLFELAERQAKMAKQSDDNREMQRCRDTIAKESLALADRARQGFIKIQCESDERKINKMMTDLGFTMPALPVEEKKEGGEEDKAAF